MVIGLLLAGVLSDRFERRRLLVLSDLIRCVVPPEQLLHANTLRELMEPLGLRFAGPALGGLLITVFDVGTAFLVDALTFLASAIVVSLMTRQPPPREERHSLRTDLRARASPMSARTPGCGQLWPTRPCSYS